MAILLTGAGSVFVRLGHLFGGMLDVLALKGGAATVRVLSTAKMAARVISTIEPDYASGTAIPQVADGLLASLSSFQSSLGALPQDFAQRVRSTLMAMWNIDTQGVPSAAPLDQLLAGDTTVALKELIRQMVSSSDSLQNCTVSAGSQTAVGTPNGDAVVVVSTKNGKGATLSLMFPETLTFRCTGDSQQGSTLGNEPLSVVGQTAVSDPLSHLYPGGSGVSTGLSAVDGSKDNSTENKLQNSDFYTYSTTDYPDNFVILAGAAGTTVFNGTASPYTSGGGAVKFTGDVGGTNISICQPFGTTPSVAAAVGGTSATLKPNTVYHVAGWCKVSATPSAGVLTFDLIDGSNANIADDAGTNNSFTKALTAVSTTYVSFTGSFRTPAVLPTTIKFRMRLSTAIDSTKSVYVGRVSLTEATQIYPGGPFCTVHSGATKLINGLAPDTWTVAIANNYSTTGTGLMHQMMDRVFGLRALGLMFPVAASPTVADSLIS